LGCPVSKIELSISAQIELFLLRSDASIRLKPQVAGAIADTAARGHAEKVLDHRCFCIAG